jgi:hypothetical protein
MIKNINKMRLNNYSRNNQSFSNNRIKDSFINIGILICISFTSCVDTPDKANIDDNKPVKDTLEVVLNQNRYSKQNDLKVARLYAKNYQPDSSSYRGIGKLENIPDSVVQAFKVIRRTDTASHERFLTLIFLKLYLDHLRCCHQSYEVRNNPGRSIDSVADPLLYEFIVSTRLFDFTEHVEFVSSAIGETWVSKNPALLGYPEIKEVVSKMRPVEDSIAKGLYW